MIRRKAVLCVLSLMAGTVCAFAAGPGSAVKVSGCSDGSASPGDEKDRDEVISGFSLSGRTLPLTRSQAEIIVPRPALKPVKSMMDTDAMVLDTLDTVNEHIKVVLYSDNTWQYIKDADYMMQAEVFKEHWDEYSTNPYKMGLDSLKMCGPYGWWTV